MIVVSAQKLWLRLLVPHGLKKNHATFTGCKQRIRRGALVAEQILSLVA